MDYREILVSTEGPIGIVTLNSPGTINALSKNMVGELIHAFTAFGSDSSVSAIVVRANGKHFCSGHNLSEMVNGSMVEYKFIFDRCTRMMNLIHEIGQPVIAEVHGVATAAGCQLAATCDLVVADETARFGTPGVRIGLFCTTPMVALSRVVGRKRAFEMLMTGRLISAAEAERYGLVNKIVPEAELHAAAMEMASTIAEASPLVVAIGKQGFYAQIEQDERRAYEFAKGTITMNLTADDAQEGIKCFLEKRTPEWSGR